MYPMYLMRQAVAWSALMSTGAREKEGVGTVPLHTGSPRQPACTRHWQRHYSPHCRCCCCCCCWRLGQTVSQHVTPLPSAKPGLQGRGKGCICRSRGEEPCSGGTGALPRPQTAPRGIPPEAPRCRRRATSLHRGSCKVCCCAVPLRVRCCGQCQEQPCYRPRGLL